MFKTLPQLIELPKLNNNIFLKNNCKKKNKNINDGIYTPPIRYIKKEKQINDGIHTPPIRYIKNNILLKITFGEKPLSIKFNTKN